MQRGASRGGGRGGQRGRGGKHTHSSGPTTKESILDLSRFVDQKINVKFSGGREGILKGWDKLVNLVLDEGEETFTDEEGNEKTRSVGLVMARGTCVVVISPEDGKEQIPNPFIDPE